MKGKYHKVQMLALGLCLLAWVSGSAQELEPVMHEGRPALKADFGSDGIGYVDRIAYRKEESFRFQAVDWATFGADYGFLFVGRSRIAFSCCDIDFPRAEVGSLEVLDKNEIFLTVSSRRRRFRLTGRMPGGVWGEASGERTSKVLEFLRLAWQDFDAAEKQFQSLTASLQQPVAPTPAATPAPPPPPAPATLVLTTQPGSVQAYVDDEFKGMSSSEGRLVVGNLPPGSHRLRISAIGYKEVSESLDLAAGESKTIEAKLEPAGPKPLELAEIDEALTNGLSPKRLTTLVKQFGVDFALTDEVQQRLRAKGADDALLLAIATGKK